MRELAEKTGRAEYNLSRTLKAMVTHGLVHFEKGPGRQSVPRLNCSGVETGCFFQ